MNDIVAVLWLFLPAGVANAVPVLAAKIPVLKKFDQPIDAYRTYRGKRLLGDNKTIRGLLTGVGSAAIIAALQIIVHTVTDSLDSIQLIRYDYSALFIAAVMGFGALLGDAIESFFKRQLAIESGNSWYFFDQIDYIIGGLVCSLPFFRLTLAQYILLTVCWLIIHPITTTAAWLLKLKDKPL